jgi:hypothetical protein
MTTEIAVFFARLGPTGQRKSRSEVSDAALAYGALASFPPSPTMSKTVQPLVLFQVWSAAPTLIRWAETVS